MVWSPTSTRRSRSSPRSWVRSESSGPGTPYGRCGAAARIGVEQRPVGGASSAGSALRSGSQTGSMASNIKKIGVIGAGQMGGGIAHVCALAGFDVKLNDLSPDRIKAGIATINGNMARQVRKETITEEQRQSALKRIGSAEDYDGFAECDLVIEAATEKEEVKRAIFAKLCASLKPDAIIGTNTSSISITRLAASTDRPERFIGIHFMNPVPLMELVELIRGIATEDSTFEFTKQ